MIAPQALNFGTLRVSHLIPSPSLSLWERTFSYQIRQLTS